MVALLQAERLRERLVPGRGAREPAEAGRGFRVAGDALMPVDAARSGGDIVAVPSEQVLLLRVELPLASHRKRLEALPFAVEDRIADPIEGVHVALGAEVAPRTYLAAVVRHAIMRDWIGMIEDAGVAGAALVPDALLLPAPPDGHWAIEVEGERALVRLSDGTGFATGLAHLPLAWAAGGKPRCIAWSGGVPDSIGATLADPMPGRPASGMPPINLRQGAYAYRRPALSAIRRRVLTVAAAGIVAHGAIAAADTLALRRQAHVREVETRALLAATVPGAAAADGTLSDALAALPPARVARSPDGLLPILSRISSAIGSADLDRLDYDRAAHRLTLTVEHGSEARLAALLNGAGFMAAAAATSRVVVTGLDT